MPIANAMHHLGSIYKSGEMGLPQDRDKAMELWLRAGELGCACAEAYFCLGGTYYRRGQGVERDIEEAKHYYELTAMEGNIFARHNIGVLEIRQATWIER